MLKVGVVGLGSMGNNHVRLYSQMNCELVGVADVDLNRAKEIGGKYKTQYYSDYRELLHQVEAVSIAVPTTLHHKIAMDFLKNRVHCLVEKPIAVSLEQADEMIKEADKQKVNLAIGHIERFNPAVTGLKQIIDAGTLGKILIISTRRVGPSASRIRDVGIVIDSATHDIGVIKYLVSKDPINVFSRVGRLKHPKEDHAIIVLDFVDSVGCIEVNWFTPQKIRTLVVTGSEGIAYLDYIEQTLKIIKSQDTSCVDIIKAEPLKLEIDDFLSSIIEGKKPLVDGKEGKAILEIALESDHNNYISLRTGQETEECSISSLHRPRVLATIPCFNTQTAIENVVLKAKKYVDEVVVIDDGSSDMTAIKAKSIGALVISHGKNKGYGATLKSCFTSALAHNADIIVTIDGDGQHNPDEIPQLVEPLIKGKADAVIGSRFLLPIENMPSYRRFGISVINLLWNFGAKTKYSDSQSGFRAYRRRVIDNLNISEVGMGASIEIIEQLRKMKVDVKEVPITCSYKNNNSHISIRAIQHGILVILAVLKTRLKYIFK